MPLLGELCILDLPRPDGRLGDSVAAATLPEVAEQLCEIRRRWPLDPGGSHPVARVLRSGRALVVPDLDKGGALDDVAHSSSAWGETHRFAPLHAFDTMGMSESAEPWAPPSPPLSGDTDCVRCTGSYPGLTDECYRGSVARYVWDLADREAGGWVTCNNKSYDLAFTLDHYGAHGRFHHVTYALDSREEILRAADIFLEAGVHIETGPHKHAIQQTFFLYVYEPGGNRVEVANAGARLVLAPDWQPVVWTQEERKKGQAWGLKTIESFHTHGTPPVEHM